VCGIMQITQISAVTGKVEHQLGRTVVTGAEEARGGDVRMNTSNIEL
jgi:hypothetical protein